MANRPRTYKGYNRDTILNEYATRDLNDNDFWEATEALFGVKTMSDFRQENMNNYRDSVLEAHSVYHEKWAGMVSWGEEDEDELEMVLSLYFGSNITKFSESYNEDED